MKRRAFVRLINSLEELNRFALTDESPEYDPISPHMFQMRMMLNDEFARLPLDTLTKYFESRAQHPQTPVPFEFGGFAPGAHLVYDASDLYDYCVGKTHKLKVVVFDNEK